MDVDRETPLHQKCHRTRRSVPLLGAVTELKWGDLFWFEGDGQEVCLGDIGKPLRVFGEVLYDDEGRPRAFTYCTLTNYVCFDEGGPDWEDVVQHEHIRSIRRGGEYVADVPMVYAIRTSKFEAPAAATVELVSACQSQN